MTDKENKIVNSVLAHVTPLPIIGDNNFVETFDICTEDLRSDAEFRPFVHFAALLKTLEGKKVEKAEWINEPSSPRNPRGTLGRYRVTWTQ